MRIQTLSEILPQILLHLHPARGHPPNPRKESEKREKRERKEIEKREQERIRERK